MKQVIKSEVLKTYCNWLGLVKMAFFYCPHCYSQQRFSFRKLRRKKAGCQKCGADFYLRSKSLHFVNSKALKVKKDSTLQRLKWWWNND